MKTTPLPSDTSPLVRRAHFPRGLFQPEGSFRFSQDALTLAEYGIDHCMLPTPTVADLGCGCGVVGLAFLLRVSQARVIGLERNAQLCEAARTNASLLDLKRFTVVEGDVANRKVREEARLKLVQLTKATGQPEPLPLEEPEYPPERDWEEYLYRFVEQEEIMSREQDPTQFDMVLCNPPWRLLAKGRVPPAKARRDALFGEEETLSIFFHAADALLKNRGSLITICGAERTVDMIAALPERLKPVRLRFVHPKPRTEARFVLMQAIKNSGEALRIEEPLILDNQKTGRSR